MNDKLKKILEKYGTVAIVIYLVTFLITFVSVFSLLQFGFKDSVVAFFQEHLGERYSSAGTLAVAYAITKVTQPIRIGVTIVLVPFFAKEKEAT